MTTTTATTTKPGWVVDADGAGPLQALQERDGFPPEWVQARSAMTVFSPDGTAVWQTKVFAALWGDGGLADLAWLAAEGFKCQVSARTRNTAPGVGTDPYLAVRIERDLYRA